MTEARHAFSLKLLKLVFSEQGIGVTAAMNMIYNVHKV